MNRDERSKLIEQTMNEAVVWAEQSLSALFNANPHPDTQAMVDSYEQGDPSGPLSFNEMDMRLKIIRAIAVQFAMEIYAGAARCWVGMPDDMAEDIKTTVVMTIGEQVADTVFVQIGDEGPVGIVTPALEGILARINWPYEEGNG